jgi:hypothetical protein
LELCELVPKSVKAVTDIYEYKAESSAVRFQIHENEIEFDEAGIFRFGRFADNSGMYISIIERDNTGALSGKVYRVPESLIYAVGSGEI